MPIPLSPHCIFFQDIVTNKHIFIRLLLPKGPIKDCWRLHYMGLFARTYCMQLHFFVSLTMAEQSQGYKTIKCGVLNGSW